MLEIIAGATAGLAAAVVAAGVSRHRRSEAHLVRPARFERELEKVQAELANDGNASCEYCQTSMAEAEARIIYRHADGRKGVVCNETACLLAYMRSTAQQARAARSSAGAA